MSWEDGIKDVAEHFYYCGYNYMYELEFGQADFAKKFEQCWKEFLERSKGDIK